MDFFIISVSHHQTPVAVREKFIGLKEAEHHLYGRHAESGVLKESLVLSTCNRLEIMAVCRELEAGRAAVFESMAQVSGLAADDIRPYAHLYTGLGAARHLFRVAASLDSLVLGESQILGQVKDAFRQALGHRRAGAIITKMMHRAFRTAKRVRSETNLAGGTVSVAGAAVALAKTLRDGDLGKSRALVLGAGSMASLAAAHLKKRAPADLVIMNRTMAKAEILAAKHGLKARPWEELDQAIMETDLIIAATAAQKPVLTSSRLESIMAIRGSRRPLIIIDIGVPRNAAHDLKFLGNMVLRNIDDLNEVVWENQAARTEAAERAEEIIEEETAKFGQWLKSLASQPTVAALTLKAERIRRLELEKTLNQNNFNPKQRAALEAMTGALVRRLLHDPLVFIKNTAKGNGEWECSDREVDCGRTGAGCRAKPHCLNYLKRAFNIVDGDKGQS